MKFKLSLFLILVVFFQFNHCFSARREDNHERSNSLSSVLFRTKRATSLFKGGITSAFKGSSNTFSQILRGTRRLTTGSMPFTNGMKSPSFPASSIKRNSLNAILSRRNLGSRSLSTSRLSKAEQDFRFLRSGIRRNIFSSSSLKAGTTSRFISSTYPRLVRPEIRKPAISVPKRHLSTRAQRAESHRNHRISDYFMAKHVVKNGHVRRQLLSNNINPAEKKSIALRYILRKFNSMDRLSGKMEKKNWRALLSSKSGNTNTLVLADPKTISSAVQGGENVGKDSKGNQLVWTRANIPMIKTKIHYDKFKGIGPKKPPYLTFPEVDGKTTSPLKRKRLTVGVNSDKIIVHFESENKGKGIPGLDPSSSSGIAEEVSESGQGGSIGKKSDGRDRNTHIGV